MGAYSRPGSGGNRSKKERSGLGALALGSGQRMGNHTRAGEDGAAWQMGPHLVSVVGAGSQEKRHSEEWR